MRTQTSIFASAFATSASGSFVASMPCNSLSAVIDNARIAIDQSGSKQIMAQC